MNMNKSNILKRRLEFHRRQFEKLEKKFERAIRKAETKEALKKLDGA